jgi:large subunit ribosomal protein L4
MPKKQRRLALKVALSDKVKSGDFCVLESLDFEAPKTKQVVKMLADFKFDGKALLITKEYAENVERSARNIPGVKAVTAAGINVLDILYHGKLFVTKDAVERMEEVFA